MSSIKRRHFSRLAQAVKQPLAELFAGRLDMSSMAQDMSDLIPVTDEQRYLFDLQVRKAGRAQPPLNALPAAALDAAAPLLLTH